MKLSRLIWVIVLFLLFIAAGNSLDSHASSKVPAAQTSKSLALSPTTASRTKEFNRLVMSTAVVAPLGINPLIALGALGFAAQGGHWTPPQGLEVVSSPWVWGTLLLLGFILKFGRSFKLTKPLAEFIGTSESVLGLISTALVVWPVTESLVSTHMQAGVAAQFGLLMFGFLAYSVVCAMRLAFDILIWISPFPLVDAAFQIAKLVVTVALILLAIFFPWVAFFVNLAIVLVSLLALRWALRLTRFAMTVAGDMVWRKNRTDELPRVDGVTGPDDFGPLMAFNISHPNWAKRDRIFVWYIDQSWKLSKNSDGYSEAVQFSGHQAILQRGVLGFTLVLGEDELFLPPRYEPLIGEISKKSGAQVEGFADFLRPSFGRS